MVTTALIVATLALLALSLTATSGVKALCRSIDRQRRLPAPEATPTPPLDEQLLLGPVWEEMADLKLAIDEGIRRVDRAEKRVQKTVTSARRLVRESGLEHAGIEAEFEELHGGNGEGVEPLPAVQPDVGGTLEVDRFGDPRPLKTGIPGL